MTKAPKLRNDCFALPAGVHWTPVEDALALLEARLQTVVDIEDSAVDASDGRILAKLDPVNLVLIEGWKRDSHPKIEAWRCETGNPLIAPSDPTILAVASDIGLEIDRPVFDLDDTVIVADFILGHLDLTN